MYEQTDSLYKLRGGNGSQKRLQDAQNLNCGLAPIDFRIDRFFTFQIDFD